MIKQLITTQTIPCFGHASEFLSNEYVITPTLDGYWVQGPSRAAHIPKNLCIPVFDGSKVEVPDWVGVIEPGDGSAPLDNTGKPSTPQDVAPGKVKRGGGLVSP